MGFYQYFCDRVSAIREYMNKPKPDLIPERSWKGIVSMQSECLEDLSFLRDVYDSMSDSEKTAVDAKIKKSQEVQKLLEQEFHGVTVADKVVKLIFENRPPGSALELGDLSRYLACFRNGSESTSMKDLRL